MGKLEEKEPEEKSNPLGYREIPALIRQFAIPSIVAMLISSLYNIVDQIYIGHIEGIGMLGNAATNVAYPLTTICVALSLLIGSGSAVMFSLKLGNGEPKEAAKSVACAISMVVVLAVPYAIFVEAFLPQLLNLFGATETVLPYSICYVRWTAIGMPFLIFSNAMECLIRADGSPKYSMVCMITGAVANTILDPIFIFALKMDIAGAAIATVISQILTFALTMLYLARFKQITLSAESFRNHIYDYAKIASFGLSGSLTQVAITLVQIVMNNSLTYYGRKSVYGADIPLSTFGIVMKMNAIVISIFVGIHQGCQPILGYNYGAKQYDRVKATYKLAMKWCFCVSTAAFFLFQFFPQYLISLFGRGNELYLEFAVKFMRIFLFMVIINGVQIISSNMFSAIGKPLKGVLLSLSRQFIILVPMILILPLFYGIDGTMFAGPISDMVSFIVSVVMVRVEFKKMNASEPASA